MKRLSSWLSGQHLDSVSGVQLIRFSPEEMRSAFVTYKPRIKKHLSGLPNCFDERKRPIAWGDAVPSKMKAMLPAVFVVPAQFLDLCTRGGGTSRGYR